MIVWLEHDLIPVPRYYVEPILFGVSHHRKSVGTKLKQTKLSGKSELAHEDIFITTKCDGLNDLDIETSTKDGLRDTLS